MTYIIFLEYLKEVKVEEKESLKDKRQVSLLNDRAYSTLKNKHQNLLKPLSSEESQQHLYFFIFILCSSFMYKSLCYVYL